jgi:hypothetical protein
MDAVAIRTEDFMGIDIINMTSQTLSLTYDFLDQSSMNANEFMRAMNSMLA